MVVVIALTLAGAIPAPELPAGDAETRARPWASSSGLNGLGISQDRYFRAWVELGGHIRSGRRVLAPNLGLGFRFASGFDVELALPFVVAATDSSSSDRTATRTRAGNPVLTVSLTSDPGARTRVKGGFRIAAPVARAGGATPAFEDRTDSDGEEATYAAGLIIRGLQDVYLYYPDVVGLALPVHVEVDQGRYVTLGLDATLAALVRTERGRGPDHEWAVEAAPSVTLWPTDELNLGLRMVVVSIPTFGVDATQVSFEPSFAYHRRLLSFAVRVNLPIDAPFGPFTGGGAGWGLFVTVGVGL